MSDSVIIALVSGLPAIILAIVALVKSFKSDAKAAKAVATSERAETMMRKM